jgi:hypothetical protein
LIPKYRIIKVLFQEYETGLITTALLYVIVSGNQEKTRSTRNNRRLIPRNKRALTANPDSLIFFMAYVFEVKEY